VLGFQRGRDPANWRRIGRVPSVQNTTRMHEHACEDLTCLPYVLLLCRVALVPQFHCLATRCRITLGCDVAFKRVPG
jgi:hypothetical protein